MPISNVGYVEELHRYFLHLFMAERDDFADQFRPSSPGCATTSNATGTVSNSILGQFTFGNGIQPVLAQVLPNVTYAFANSVIENGAGLLAGVCGANGVICNVDAKLEELADYGGSGSAVISGTGITQAQWDSARNNLNANCGTNFAP